MAQARSRMLSVAEVVKASGVSRTKVYEAIKANQLPSFKPGTRKNLISYADMMAWRESMRSGPNGPAQLPLQPVAAVAVEEPKPGGAHPDRVIAFMHACTDLLKAHPMIDHETAKRVMNAACILEGRV